MKVDTTKIKEILSKLKLRSTTLLTLLPFFLALGTFILINKDKDITNLAMVVAAITGPLYAGAGAKAWAKYKNGGAK